MNDPSCYCPTYPSSLPTHIVPSHSRCHQLSKQIHNTINSLGDIPLANFDVRRHVEMTRVNVQPGEESVSGELWQWKVTWDLHSRVQSTFLLLLSGFFPITKVATIIQSVAPFVPCQLKEIVFSGKRNCFIMALRSSPKNILHDI